MALLMNIWVPGDPHPMPRPKVTTAGKFARAYYPKGPWKAWKEICCLHFGAETPREPHDGPMGIGVEFYFKRPKRLLRKKDPDGKIWHGKTHDLDNLMKLLKDSLTSVDFWVDDSRVSSMSCQKHYVPRDGESGARVVVWSLEEAS